MADDLKSVVKATVLEDRGGTGGESKQLDLAKFNYDQYGCARPNADPEVLASLYGRNVAHKACVDAKTTNCVGLGWRLEPKEGEEDTAELAAVLTDWLEALARRGNCTLDDLLVAARKDEEAVGWGAIEVTRDGQTHIDGLYHVHAFTLRRRAKKDGWVQLANGEYVVFRDYGRKVDETKDPTLFEGTNEILVVGEAAPDSPFYPTPDHVPALGDIAGDEAAQSYQNQFFTNNAVPRLAILVKGGKLTDEAKQYVLDFLKSGIRGEAHKTLLLETEAGEGVEITLEPLTIGQTEDASFTTYRKECRNNVIMAHRVSPTKVTIVEDANLANSRDQDKTFKEQVLRPDQNRWEKRLQWLLEDEFGAGLPVIFRFEEMDLADELQEAQTRSYYHPAMTNNEVRQDIGMLPAGEDADGNVVDVNLWEWGKQPFEGSYGAAISTGTTGQQGEPTQQNAATQALTQVTNKRVSAEHRAFVGLAQELGYIIEEIREVAGDVKKAAQEGTQDAPGRDGARHGTGR